MHGDVCDMTFNEWIKGFLRHSALAMVIFTFLALGLERLIPGFVEPFLNLPMLFFVTLLVTICALTIRDREPSLGSRMVMAFLLGIAVIPAGFFLWTRVGDLGISAWALCAAGVLVVGLCIAVLVSSEES